ncbi:MAG: hypothetical protein ACLFMT_02560 [Halobacteriales archaeon]
MSNGQTHVLGSMLLLGLVVTVSAGTYYAVAGIETADPDDTVDGYEFQAEFTAEIHDSPLSHEELLVLRHGSDAAYDVGDLEVQVETPRRNARLVDLPLPDCPTTNELDDAHTDGDPVFQAGCQWGGPPVESTSDEWTRDAELVVRLSRSDLPALTEGETLTVTVVDASEDAVLGRTEVEA